MNERPLERLNYFNGQRLQAGDFRLEQDYHMRVRRWLNRSLYTAGIAMGLEVYAVPGRPVVKVQPGLAIDTLGREIILLEAQDVPVMHDAADQGMKGSYLVIRYHEELLAQQDACCSPVGADGDRRALGGPSRVLAEPVLECVPDLPHEASGKVLLGRVVLADGCGSIAGIDASVRHYIGDASAAKVRQYALEGFRDVDPDNPATVRFHIRGRQPASVSLYLRSERFPRYFYTEIGRHAHTSSADAGLGATTGPASQIDSHVHSSGSIAVASHQNHRHQIFGWVSTSTAGGPFDFLNPLEWPNFLGTWPPGPTFIGNGPPNAPPYMLRAITTIGAKIDADPIHIDVMPVEENVGNKVGLRLSSETLTHSVTGNTGAPSSTLPAAERHTHSFNASIDEFGADIAASDGQALAFVTNLKIHVDGRDVTDAVLTQIRSNRPPTEQWSSLGTGGAGNDPFSTYGTGAIRLDYLVPIDEKEHEITLSVPVTAGKRNGGRIHYNLYVE